MDGKVISLDNADALLEGRSDFANGEEMTGQDNVLPCDMVGRERDPKEGVSGRKVWDR